MESVHSLCLLEGDEANSLQPLYEKVGSYTSRNFAVIYAVESDTTQTAIRMRQNGLDVETLVESGLLTIVDRNEMYSIERTELDGHALMDVWYDVYVKVKRRSSFGGVLAIGSAENFIGSPSYHDKLVKYEEMVGKKFQIPLEAICCYSSRAFEAISLGNVLSILNAHHSVAHGGANMDEWDPLRIIELAHKGMSRAVGNEVTDLFFKTLKLCYKIDGEAIASSPATLERMLSKLLGEDAARLAIASIKDEVRRCISP
ncbi:MAG TPA: MEDS domain-containing protein [Nitrososphaera sp.]